MPYPVAVVEVAFADGPYVVSPTWTDVTSYVRGMEISRGVPDDWTLQADGSATVVLSNRDRRFDPFNTTGPYYGNLLPRRQIRIRATHSGTTYDVFRGFIAGWPPEWTDAGKDSTVTLQCFDALQLLGSSSLPADWSRDYILSLSPRHYYPCDEPLTSFTAGSLKDYGSYPLNITTTTNASTSHELAPGLPSHSVQAVGVGGLGTTGLVASGLSPNEITMSLWGVFDASNAAACAFTNCAMGIGFDQNTGKYVVEVSDVGAGTIRIITTTNTYDNSTARLIASTFNATTKAQELYIDGVAVATTTTTAGAILFGAESVTLDNGQFQQVCVFTSRLTATQIRNIYNYSIANFPETTSARFNRIIAETPFSASLTSVPASPASSVLDITNDAPTAVSELDKVAVSEYAPLFVTKAGTVTMYSQSQIRTQTKSIVPQAEYGNGVGFMGNSIGTEVQLQYDGDSMRNVSNIQMSGGGVYIQTNSSSVTTYGEAEQYVETQVASLADAVDIANIVNGWGGNVYAKASPVSVVLSPTASWASTLGLELFDRFTLQVTPPSGNAITTPMLTSRISHSVTPERWFTTLEGSARWAAVFILNQSRLGGTDLLG
jgi:hypothetical protein